MKTVPPLFRPPIIGLALIIISTVLHFVFPIMKFIHFPYNMLGLSGIVIGLWLSLWGKNAFQEKDTPFVPGEKPNAIVVEGPFNLTRNPMYLGFVILLTGIAILFGSVIAFISPIAFALIIHNFLIPFEEKLMEKTFGKKYLDYKRKVRRWL